MSQQDQVKNPSSPSSQGQAHQPLDRFLNLKFLEPYIGLALVCHGILITARLGGDNPHWLALALVALVSLLAFIPALQSKLIIQLRAVFYTLITAYLILNTGASKSFFLLWYLVIVAYYPLLLGTVGGLALISFISSFYLSTLLIEPGLPPSVVVARTLLLTFIGVIAFTLSYRLRSFDRLQILANSDSLTGLKNRRYFFEVAEVEFNRAQRYQSPLCMIIADINHFKQVNDRYGHAIGDDALMLCAALISHHTRESDIACRLGGDEFAILLPCTDKQHAQASVERLQRAFQQNPLKIPGETLQLQMSFGLAEITAQTNSIRALYKAADLSMYDTKNESRAETRPGKASADTAQETATGNTAAEATTPGI